MRGLWVGEVQDLTIFAKDFLFTNRTWDQPEHGGRIDQHWDDGHQAGWLGSLWLRSFQVKFLTTSLSLLSCQRHNHGFQVLSLQSWNWGDSLTDSNLLGQDHHILLHLLHLPRSFKHFNPKNNSSCTYIVESNFSFQPHSGLDAFTSSSSLYLRPTPGSSNHLKKKKLYWLFFSLTIWFQMDTGCFHHWQQPRFLTKNFLQKSEYWKQIEMPSQTLYSRDKKSFFQALDFDRVLLMNVLTPPCLRLRFLSSISISSPLILLLHWGSGIF